MSSHNAAAAAASEADFEREKRVTGEIIPYSSFWIYANLRHYRYALKASMIARESQRAEELQKVLLLETLSVDQPTFRWGARTARRHAGDHVSAHRLESLSPSIRVCCNSR